jgi:glutathione S-transferase
MQSEFSSWINQARNPLNMEYKTVEEAIDAPGLRLVLTAGVPGPWGESAKSILDYKGLAYIPVFQEGGGENQALQDWTGQNSAPVAIYEDLPPVSHWLDLLMLAERLAPEKPLLPGNPTDEARVVGLSTLLAGVNGFAWNRRLQMFAPMLRLDEPPEMIARMGRKYGWSEEAHAGATARLQSISEELTRTLALQKEAGSSYFVGDKVTALDFYWANFAGMIKPLAPEDNPMPDFIRSTYEATDEATAQCLTPLLEEHRDFMYQQHISLPLDF